MRILIIEDDQDIRDSLSQVLEADGYVISVARDGLRALEFLRTCGVAPHLILLDIAMPVMNGFDFRELQLQDANICSIPVIAFSAMRWSDWMKDRLGCDGYFSKPVKLEELEEAIARFDPRNTGHPARLADEEDTRRFAKK